MLSAPFIVSVSLWKHGNRVEWRTGAIPGSQAKHLGYRWGDTQRREQMIQARRTYRRYLQGEAKIRVQGFKPKFREQKDVAVRGDIPDTSQRVQQLSTN